MSAPHDLPWSFSTPSQSRVHTLNIRFWGVKTPPPLVLWIPAPTTPTTIIHPSHALPPHPTPPVFHHRSILNPRAWVSALGPKLPPPLVLWIPGSTSQATTPAAFHTLPAHTPHIPFNPVQYRVHHAPYSLLGVKTLPPLVLWIPASTFQSTIHTA